jgi:hypothetical protein
MSEQVRTFLAFLLAQGVIFTGSPAPASQISNERKVNQNVRVSAPARVEPLRVINGEMQGRTIAGQFIRNGRVSNFSLTLTKAEIVGAKLELLGSVRTSPNLQSAQNVRVKIAGSMAMAANPWPHASDDDEAREEISGCGVLFLSLELPAQSRVAMGAARPLQVGVVLAPLDNSLGEEINKRICAIVRMLDDKSDSQRLSAAVGELNRLLARPSNRNASNRNANNRNANNRNAVAYRSPGLPYSATLGKYREIPATQRGCGLCAHS